MEYYEIRKWLDDIVDTIESQQKLQYFNSLIRTHSVGSDYYISEGLNIISDVLKIPICHKEVNSSFANHRYSIVYRGVEFIQLEENPLEGGYYENV